MIDQKFSYDAFEKLGLDSEEAKRLCDELQVAVCEEFNDILKRKMDEVAESLNAMGHNLQVFEDENYDGTIDYGYRDHNDNGIDGRQIDYVCKLRLGIDLIVSAGFGHLFRESQHDPVETLQ